ncbi:hypothetical protein TNCV_2984661 [Trichonephila clavipes]|nr:hypothetical protein TNCV_2984661 [Trichonephila clavipes]
MTNAYSKTEEQGSSGVGKSGARRVVFKADKTARKYLMNPDLFPVYDQIFILYIPLFEKKMGLESVSNNRDLLHSMEDETL